MPKSPSSGTTPAVPSVPRELFEAVVKLYLDPLAAPIPLEEMKGVKRVIDQLRAWYTNGTNELPVTSVTVTYVPRT